MQNKTNNLWAVSREPTSIVAIADPTSSIVVLDEASLKDVSGGCKKCWNRWGIEPCIEIGIKH